MGFAFYDISTKTRRRGREKGKEGRERGRGVEEEGEGEEHQADMNTGNFYKIAGQEQWRLPS